MNHPSKEITFICTFQTVIGNYLTVPSSAYGGLVTGSDTSPGKYSTFDYFGDTGLIALDEFPDVYLGCTGDKGYLTTVDGKSAVPFTMPQSGFQDTVVSTMKGQVQATAGTYKGKVWYYLGGFHGGIEMANSSATSNAIFTMTILDHKANRN